MNLLVGYDVSKHSAELVDAAIRHAIAFGANVDILVSTPHSPEVAPDKIERMQKDLDGIKHRLEAEGIHCDVIVLSQSLTPAEDLIRYAVDYNIDEIIIGARRRSKLGKFIMGSTAQYIIMEAPCDVLIVKQSHRK